MADLAKSFHDYSAWRDSLAHGVGQVRAWLDGRKLLDSEGARRIDQALDRLADDKLTVAVVAEFSRGKSELINSIFFADYGKRILPSSAGRTTMCPTELQYDETIPPCIRALPIETRARPGSTSEFKRSNSEWRVYPLNTLSADGMFEAFKLVSETIRVPADEAKMYGLFDPDDIDQRSTVDAEGSVEIPRWRHAVINFPHTLLKQGLVLLDTPGLNAIGAEPELTLSLVPSAHAVLFVLAADTGVTKSDLEMWRHVVRDSGAADNHIAVLNKIDGLWDGLKTVHEIDDEVSRQVEVVSRRLGLPSTRIFPVSAQKGLVAKVTSDDPLLAASRLPELESALVNLLVPAKQRIVRDQTVATLDRIGEEVRQTLNTRERGLIEQLYELRALQGKNSGQIDRMLSRARSESREFEQVARKVVATRFVLNKIAEQAMTQLRRETLRTQALEARERMRKAWMPTRFGAITTEFFDGLRGHLRSANDRIAEMEKMIAGVQQNFAQELGWSLPAPMPFSINDYIGELTRMEEASRVQFSTFSIITRGKWDMIERFLETVVSRCKEIFASAERDVEAWIGSLLPPIEAQVREQRSQLAKRTESVERIRGAQESLDSRIAELETTIEQVQRELDELRIELDAARRLARDGNDGRYEAALISGAELGLNA
jgi:Dynamin family